ncbi:MAG TPA: nuclear transport factor 2 family protein [Flavobacteriaceae bacterium]|nr:nuclear transport factor 2 family protein [Flavobacteriaceae bacterium]
MNHLLRFIACFIVATATSQNENQQLELEIKQTIETFFEGFHRGDTLLMKSVLADKVLLHTIFKNKQGTDQLVTEEITTLLKAIGNKPGEENWEEKLLAFQISVDGAMANAWTPYEFWFNGNFSHCGVNSFQLFKDKGQWKIIYLIDTRRKEGCLKG